MSLVASRQVASLSLVSSMPRNALCRLLTRPVEANESSPRTPGVALGVEGDRLHSTEARECGLLRYLADGIDVILTSSPSSPVVVRACKEPAATGSSAHEADDEGSGSYRETDDEASRPLDDEDDECNRALSCAEAMATLLAHLARAEPVVKRRIATPAVLRAVLRVLSRAPGDALHVTCDVALHDASARRRSLIAVSVCLLRCVKHVALGAPDTLDALEQAGAIPVLVELLARWACCRASAATAEDGNDVGARHDDAHEHAAPLFREVVIRTHSIR